MTPYETIPVVDDCHPVVNMNEPLIAHDDPFFTGEASEVTSNPLSRLFDGPLRAYKPTDETESRRMGNWSMMGSRMRHS